MNESPETEFDLEKLFLPSWAQESPTVNKYAGFAGEDRRESRSDDRHGPRRGPPRPGGGDPRSKGGGRPQGQGPRHDGGQRGGPDARGPRPEGRPRFEPREAAPPPLPQLSVTILPDDKGLDSLARQIRMTGRAYPLFDIAQLILQKPERQLVRWDIIKDAAGKPAQPLHLCALDDSLWLSEDEAVTHLLGKNFDMFYKAEKTTVEPPKGTYTFVAQCGLSGQILGPPNYHDYQSKLHKLHNERFARMPFEAFKARVKIVKDEAVVKKWIEDQSTKTQYACLNMPEALVLPTREAVEKHFRETHLPNLIKLVESHTMSGPAARQLRSPALQRLLRAAWEEQRRFPLKLATTLSQQLAARGLQFFKVNRTVTHVSVARPRFLDMEATPVSEGVRRIVEFINATTKCTRRKLIEALVQSSAAPHAPAPKPASVPDTAVAETPAAAPEPQAGPEQTALAGDLHWLVHEGHVIEFANGVLETAKRPIPKPPKPQPVAAAPESPAKTTGESPVNTIEDVPTPPAASAADILPGPDNFAATAQPEIPASAPDPGHSSVPVTETPAVPAAPSESQPG